MSEQSGSLHYNFIGANYIYLQDYATVLRYFNKVKPYINWHQNNLKVLYGQIATCFLGLGNLDSAYYYNKKAYDLDVMDDKHWSVVYSNMGAIEEKRGNFKKSIYFFKIASELEKRTYTEIATAFKKMGQLDSALYYANKSMDEAKKQSHYYALLYGSSLLTEIYKAEGMLDSAFTYQELMLAAKDSLYSQEKLKQVQNLELNERQRQQQVEQQKKEALQQYQTKVKVFSLLAGLGVLSLFSFILFRSNRHKQQTNALLEQQKEEIGIQRDNLQQALNDLKAAQAQLIQREKMASLGELTAGIAHEIQNPLNFVNNFAEANVELLNELEQELGKGKVQQAKIIARDAILNEQKINLHGKRADAIVKGGDSAVSGSSSHLVEG